MLVKPCLGYFSIFLQNGYSYGLFRKQVKRFFDDKYNTVSESIDESEKAFEKTYLLMIPCVGKPSLIFKQKMSELVKEMYDVKIKYVFTSLKVKDYFSLKRRSSLFLLSDSVYKFTCQCDTHKFYFGETDRHIGIRGGEKASISCENIHTKP